MSISIGTRRIKGVQVGLCDGAYMKCAWCCTDLCHKGLSGWSAQHGAVAFPRSTGLALPRIGGERAPGVKSLIEVVNHQLYLLEGVWNLNRLTPGSGVSVDKPAC